MTDLQCWVAPTCDGLADVLAAAPAEAWNAPSLCEKWQVRHVVALLSGTVAARDARLPLADQLDALRSPVLHAWQPPGGGAAGALSHAVVHSLDVTC